MLRADSRIHVAGHRGLVGSALVSRLQAGGFQNLILASRADLDLTDPHATLRFFQQQQPEYVFMAAGKVGGILANATQPAEFLYENAALALSVINAAYQTGVTKLMYFGSSCVYPRNAQQPLREDYLLTGPLEKTNQAYAIAKITGIELCRAYHRQYGSAFFSVMPSNLYGPNDNFDLTTSHVLPALIRRFHEASTSGADSVLLWGTGTPRREFTYVDDVADAAVFLMDKLEGGELLNIGTGREVTIAELAAIVARVVGFDGAIEYDASKPDGSPRKVMDVSKLTALGWRPKTSLEEGIRQTYEAFLAHYHTRTLAPS